MVRKIQPNPKASMFKEAVAFVIRHSGISLFVRNVYARSKCCILVYHNPSPDVFDKHLNYLSRWYNISTLAIQMVTIRKGR